MILRKETTKTEGREPLLNDDDGNNNNNNSIQLFIIYVLSQQL
jgi:hypothetical protein